MSTPTQHTSDQYSTYHSTGSEMDPYAQAEALPLRRLISWLTSITKPVHKPLLASTAFRFVTLGADVAIFALVGASIGNAILGNYHALGILLPLLVLLAVVKAAAYYLEQLTGHYVAFKALELLRTATFASMWPKAPGIVTHSRSGDVLASLTRDVDRIEVVYAHTFAPVVSSVVVPTAAVVLTATLVDPIMAFGLAIPLAISVFLVPWLGFSASSRATARALHARRDLAHHITDSVFGREEVASFGRQAERLQQMDHLSDNVTVLSRPGKRAAGARRGLNLFLLLLAVMWIAVRGVSLGLDVPLVVALVLGALRLWEGPRGIEDAAGYLDHSFAAARRLWAIAHTPAHTTDGPRDLAQELPAEELGRAGLTITFDNVSYSYGRGFALNHISFSAHPGKRTVLVGPSGSGKSTVLQLLLRYDDPSSGTISIEGVPAQEFTLDSLRGAVVSVSQKNQVLASSIAENLRLGAPHASEEDLWRALALVHLDEEVRAMPAQLDTFVGEDGQALSGGQLQRLCLARAVLMAPRVLLLDEFTAHLNAELEAQIRADVDAAFPGVTIIEVTHRLEQIPTDVQVVRFDRGRAAVIQE